MFPTCIRTQEMWGSVISVGCVLLCLISKQVMTQGMREYAIDNFLCTLASIPNSFKTPKMCENAVIEDPFSVEYFPDCYRTQNV